MKRKRKKIEKRTGEGKAEKNRRVKKSIRRIRSQKKDEKSTNS